MRLIAAAVFAGLALIAGGIVATGDRWNSSDDASYDGYESVIRTWLELDDELKVDEVEQLEGAFYRARYHSKKGQLCVLVDVSRQYAAKDQLYATFWYSAGARGFGEDARPASAYACR